MSDLSCTVALIVSFVCLVLILRAASYRQTEVSRRADRRRGSAP